MHMSNALGISFSFVWLSCFLFESSYKFWSYDDHNFIYELHLLCSDVPVVFKGWSLAGFVLQGLLGPMGLMSANPLECQAAVSSFSTLMTITPRDTYIEFEKVCCLNELYFKIY